MLTVIAAVSEVELEQLKERQDEGIAIARQQGNTKDERKLGSTRSWRSITGYGKSVKLQK